MRGRRAIPGLAVAVLLLGGCDMREEGAAAPTAAATPASSRLLEPRDVETYLAVRGKALLLLEETLAVVEGSGEDVLRRVQAPAEAERQAASALGVDWQRYSWARDEIARLLAAQRHDEDARLLAAELARARTELAAQLEIARDAASRQFLQAQVASLDAQLAKLERERRLSPAEAEQMALLESVRAEIAVQQGRQERIERRIRELVRAHQQKAPPLTPAP